MPMTRRGKILGVAAGGIAATLALRGLLNAQRTGSTTYPPTDTLKPIADNLWIVDGGPLRPGGVELPIRMTVARLADGGLWIHSPTECTDALVDAITSLGRLAHLVAPNIAHWTFLAEWQRRFPEAVTWAAPGLREREQVRASGVRLDRDLGEQAPAAWLDAFDQGIITGGMGFAEAFFFHRPSRTLILVDLIQNLQAGKLPAFSRLFALLSGAEAATTPRYIRAVLRARRGNVTPQFARMLAMQPETVIFAHGDCFVDDASAKLQRALAWLR